jgi:hypothetical protein
MRDQGAAIELDQALVAPAHAPSEPAGEDHGMARARGRELRCHLHGARRY